MSNRTILIIAGLAIPVVALAILTQSAAPPKSNSTSPGKPASIEVAKPVEKAKPVLSQRLESLDEARSRVAGRLEVLNKMDQSNWDKERKRILTRNPSATPPLKVEEARSRTRKNLDRMKGMDEAQWEAEARAYKEKHKEADADGQKTDKPL